MTRSVDAPRAVAPHELYGSADLHIGRLLYDRCFDRVIITFFECLRDGMEWVRA